MSRPSPSRGLLGLVALVVVVVVVYVLGVSTGSAGPRRQQVADATRKHDLTFATLTAGERYSCGLSTAGRAYCWGASWSGQLGAGPIDSRCDESIYAKGPCARAPVEVYGDHRFVAIHAADHHACAIEDSGRPWCWGEGHFGQLGRMDYIQNCPREGSRPGEDMIVSCSHRPVAVPLAEPVKLVSIDGGETFTCGVDRAGSAWCWAYGEDEPIRRIPLDRPMLTIAAGGSRACGLTIDHGIRCWHQYEWMSKGATTPTPRTDWVALDVGTAHACALDTEGQAYCWGRDKDGALGVGTTSRGVADEEPPTAVLGDHHFRSIATGATRTCAIDTADALWCWGRVRESEKRPNDRCLDSNWIGGGNDCVSHPVPVYPGVRFAQVAVGASHRCAITAARKTVCWGAAEAGQLGNGSLQSTEMLQAVRTRGVSDGDIQLIDTRERMTTLLLNGGFALIAVVAVLLMAAGRVARWEIPHVVALWLGALVAYAVVVAVGASTMGHRAGGVSHTVAVQLATFVAGLTLFRLAVLQGAWWRAGSSAVATGPVPVLAATRPGVARRRVPDDGRSGIGTTALMFIVGGWGFVGMTMLSMQGQRYDEVSGGLAMFVLFVVAAIATAVTAAAGIAAIVRLRAHRDDRRALAAVMLAGIMLTLALVAVAVMFWPRER